MDRFRFPLTVVVAAAVMLVEAVGAPDLGSEDLPTVPLSSLQDAFSADPRVDSPFARALDVRWVGDVGYAFFAVPKFWNEREVFLRLGTRRTTAAFFLNGAASGSVAASPSFAELDITGFRDEGSNVLSVAVLREGASASGSADEILLYSTPPVDLHALGFRTRVSPDGLDAEGEITMSVVKHPRPFSYRSLKRKVWMTARLFDRERKEVAQAEPRQLDLAPDGVSTNVVATLVIANPRIWRADDPYLYTLVVQVDNDIRAAEVAVRDREGGTK